MTGVEQLVAAVLVSPDFLFRAIRTPATAKDGAAFPLSDLELASRLSFFLWSSGPDDTLLDVAAAGKLRTPDALRTQALRMLRDRRASSLVRNFALKWLDLDNLDEVEPDPNLFPTFDDGLRRDLATEVESFVVERPARGSQRRRSAHRGPHVPQRAAGAPLRHRVGARAAVPARDAGGFRGAGACSARARCSLRTSYGDRTSPVLRGAWVMDKLMGTPPTPPPPDVETDLSQSQGRGAEDAAGAARKPSLEAGLQPVPRRDRSDRAGDGELRRHRPLARPRRWKPRPRSTRRPCCRTGGPSMGPSQLREALFGGRDLFVRAFTEKLMMYAVGRELKAYDMPQVRAVVRRAAAQDYRLSAIVSGIVSSDAFRMQAPARHGEPG